MLTLSHLALSVTLNQGCLNISLISLLDMWQLEIFTLTKKEAKSVVIEWNNDKRCITGSFGISVSGNLLLI